MAIADILREQLGPGFIEVGGGAARALPAYLAKPYQLTRFRFIDVDFCMLSVSEPDFNLTTYEKHLATLKGLLSMPAAFYFPSLTTYQKSALIRRGIPFVAGENQVYLPFLGIALSRLAASPVRPKEQLSAIAQYLLLFILYERATDVLIQSELASKLALPAMGVSRAVQELRGQGLLETQASGKTNRLSLPSERVALLKKALPLMASPIQKTIRVQDAPDSSVIAGDEALGIRTDLSATYSRVRAVYRLKYKVPPTAAVLFEEDETMPSLQLWTYQPETLTKDGIADPISLYLCYRQDPDERVQKALRKMMADAGFALADKV